MSRWVVEAKKADFNSIADRFGIDPVTARILVNRGVSEDDKIDMFLNGTADMMYDPYLLKDACRAAEMISSFIKSGRKIRIIGDYDVDGVCSSYILLSVIRRCGGIADAQIPHRITDGYGINERIIEEAGNDGVQLIVTCDNGISAFDQIRHAYELGMKVIVTDHHQIPFGINDEGGKNEKMPPADVIVDPQRKGETYPYTSICGAVVAMKVMYILLDIMGIADSKEIKHSLLETSACATVCDVMPLLDENRIIVKEGLRIMNGDSGNIGIHALIEADGFHCGQLTADNIGFGIGPCINASGRLETAESALKLLCAEDGASASLMAERLVADNKERQRITAEQTGIAEDKVENEHICNEDVMIVYLPECPESIAGIVAGRIREKYFHPVFVVTDSQDGLKGSGRSIDAYDMYAHMNLFSELFTKFGGHKAAAGFSMKPDDLDKLRKGLNEDSGLQKSDMTEKIHIDVPMPIGYVTEDLLKEFDRLAPFGTGNERPLFAQKGIKILSGRLIGKNKEFGSYRISDGNGNERNMIYFGDAAMYNAFLKDHDNISSILYSPGINDFNGRRSIQIKLRDYC